MEQGRLQEAVGHYEQALRITPEYAEAQNNLALGLLQLGRRTEAIEHWEQALRIKPDYAGVHYKLGLAFEKMGRVQEAIGHQEQAVRLQPDFADACNSLAWLLATHPPAQGGDPARAVALAQRACEFTGNRWAGYLDTLAVAYAAAGRFEDARNVLFLFSLVVELQFHDLAQLVRLGPVDRQGEAPLQEWVLDLGQLGIERDNSLPAGLVGVADKADLDWGR